MLPIRFEGQNLEFLPPPGMPDCLPLPAKREFVNGHTEITSVWRLDDAEINQLIEAYKCGHGVAVSLTILTDTQPVVALSMATLK